jgi:hypothetical protein
MASIVATQRIGLLLITVAALGLSLQACSKNDVDVDGVPNVPDTKNIVVDGQRMTPSEFRDKYCQRKTMNETCQAVVMQSQMDSLIRKK